MIELYCGTIASGKSTCAKERAKEGAIIINDDAILLAVHAGDYTLYDKKLKPFYKSIETHILLSAVLMGRDVIIDRGLHLRKESRARWIALARSLEVPIHARVFPIESPEVHVERRMKSDSRGLTREFWMEAVQEHIEQYERPTLSEGFNHITVIR